MDLTYSPPTALRARTSVGSRYLAVLGACLLGYALFGRTFAYLGVPPIFIGEIMLVVGVVAALRGGRVVAALRAGPLALWAALLAWTLIRTLPYVGLYGLDAPRDAMVVGYGVYAVVVASLLLAEPERLADLIGQYRKQVVVMLCLTWALYLVAKIIGEVEPELPWAPGVGILSVKGGDLMVQMTGLVAFLMLGGLRGSLPAYASAAFSAGIIMISNRGGMVAFALGMGVAWLMRPSGAGVGKFVYVFAALLVLGVLVGPLVELQIQSGSRELSVEQALENVKSIFASSDSAALDGTKRWRLMWWGEIIDYTVRGPYFWTGKGFGINLAVSDGYEVSEDDGLRSPHNGHLSVLARGGVPGLVLWAAIHLAWALGVLGAWFRTRHRDHRRWTALFAWLMGFWVAALVNASFDVYLEGPMGGIWLWSVMGVGVAAVHLYRTAPHVLDAADLPYPPTRGVAAPRREVPFHW